MRGPPPWSYSDQYATQEEFSTYDPVTGYLTSYTFDQDYGQYVITYTYTYTYDGLGRLLTRTTDIEGSATVDTYTWGACGLDMFFSTDEYGVVLSTALHRRLAGGLRSHRDPVGRLHL